MEEMFQRALDSNEEGIVIKQLDSTWIVNDRSNNWLKLKPDYQYFSEIDGVIIGAYAGKGRRGNSINLAYGKIVLLYSSTIKSCN